MRIPATAGGCFCGALRFRFTGPPLGSMICHCRSCRRISGAPVVAWLTLPVERFEYTRGRARRLRSSANAVREFCGHCGTHLIYRHRRTPSEVDVATATLERPERWPPTHHGWVSHAVSWLRIDDGLPVHARRPESLPKPKRKVRRT